MGPALRCPLLPAPPRGELRAGQAGRRPTWAALSLGSPHRPRILEMDKEENRRSVLLPAPRRRGGLSSENYWRQAAEAGGDCSAATGGPARKVKMRRH